MADSASPPHGEDIRNATPPSATSTLHAKSAVSTVDNESENSNDPTGDNNNGHSNGDTNNDSTLSKHPLPLQKQKQKQRQQQQRGHQKKPRPKRNRKRPRSQVCGFSNDDLVIQSKVIPLTLNGKPILLTNGHGISSSSSSNDKPAIALPPPPPEQQQQRSAPILYVRIIEPYIYTFTSFAKLRWIGRTILEVYTTEFGSYPAAYYETAIRQGRILVSNEIVDASYCIHANDVLCHLVHRHEPAVLLHSNIAPYVKIVGETSTLLAVDKPGTLPIHPCGGYHENCLIKLLEPTYGKLYTIYRLDRLTSGLVIFAKSTQTAQICNHALNNSQNERSSNNTCHDKIYLARVKGHFPNNCPVHIPALVPWKTSFSKDDSTTMPCDANPSFPIDGVHGDNDDDTSIENGNDNVHHAAIKMRRRNAFGYWFSNLTMGKEVVAQKSQKMSLQRFSTMEHTAEEWLQALDQKRKRKSNDADHDDTSYGCHASTDLVWLNFACPVRISNPKIGVCECGTFENLNDETYAMTVKPAQTSFAVIRYDKASDSTIVLCRPMTGRTHQIRLHLQQLGHPIANDPNYGGEDIFFQNPEGESTRSQAQAALNAVAATKQAQHDTECLHDDNKDEPHSQQQEKVKYLRTCDDPATQTEVDRVVETKRGDDESWDEYIRRTCVWCQRDSDTTLELLVRSPGVWLHALQYSLETRDDMISFRTQLPDWSIC